MKVINKVESESIFFSVSKKLPDLLSKLNLDLDDRIIKPEWENNRLNLREKLTHIDRNFLNNSGIAGLMFQSDFDLANKEFNLIDKNLLFKIQEYDISRPEYATQYGNFSTNTIHHLFHIQKFIDNREDVSPIESVLEWGGGYGNMCKLFFETFDELKSFTIIDIPEFLIIQYVFLSSYFGEENVRIIKNMNEITDGINLISVSDVINSELSKFDLFISNWAISESTVFCQEFADRNGLFDIKNQLISFHQCGHHIPFMNESMILNQRLKNKNFKIIPIEVIPGINYYAIK